MKYLLCGNYGAGNKGDEMILEGLINFLYDLDESAEITILSGNPTETAEKYKAKTSRKFPAGVRSRARQFFTGDNVRALKNCDYFILGGGGLFAGAEGKAGDKIWSSQLTWARKFKKPVLILGQSVGTPEDQNEKKLILQAFEDSKYISVRDNKSVEILKEIGISNVKKQPDFAFYTEQNQILKKSKVLDIALRQSSNISADFITQIAEFLKKLALESWQFEFVNFQNEGAHDDRKIHDKISKKARIANPEFSLTPGGSVFLAMRLHSIIHAIRTETPFIAISYHEKVQNLLDTLGLSEFSMQVNEVTSDNLLAKFNHCLDNSATITKKLAEIKYQLKNEFNPLLKDLRQITFAHQDRSIK